MAVDGKFFSEKLSELVFFVPPDMLLALLYPSGLVTRVFSVGYYALVPTVGRDP